jgi:hypothetical protein
VSENSSQGQGFFARQMPAKWFFLAVILLVVVMAAIIVTLVLVDRSQDNARREAAAATTSTSGVASPYDLTELPADTELGVTMDASFVSIFVPNKTGRMTSYAISSELPAAQALVMAIRGGDEVDAEAVTTATGATAGGSESAALTSTITFVFPTRDTLTFTLDLDRGLIARGGQSWRPDGDLRALVGTAIAGP